jgi:hypothetical protein
VLTPNIYIIKSSQSQTIDARFHQKNITFKTLSKRTKRNYLDNTTAYPKLIPELFYSESNTYNKQLE